MELNFGSLLLLALVCQTLLWTGVLAPAPVFSIQNCDGGCKTQSDCPDNAACIPVITPSCGLCLCKVGYTLSDNQCISGSGSGDSLSQQQQVPPKRQDVVDISLENAVPPIAARSDSVTTAQLTTVAVTQESTQSNGDGDSETESAATFDCNKYKCDVPNPGKSTNARDDGKGCPDFVSKTVSCANLAGGGQCMLGTCLNVNSTTSYCLCPYGRQSRTCHVTKTGSCSHADGKLPSDAKETKGKRFRHIRDPDSGAVLARHAVDSMKDCMRLCQWSTFQQCRSFNYGVINGQKVCELLTVWANKESILYQWLKDDADWSYVCCFK